MSDFTEFFSTPEGNAQLDLIRHLIENSELVPLVRGGAGIGKTLMASRLQQSAPDNWAVCHFSAEPTLQPERLLAFIARCSGLPDFAGDLLPRLVDRFEVLRKRGRIPVILVDDAQMLPPTSLITLLRLFERQVDGARLVSVVLFADEQIDLLLTTPQLQVMSPQVIQAIDLPVLTRQEATGFMHFLLNNEGLSDHFVLDETRLGWLYKETRGIPGPLATAILNEVGRENSAKQPFFSGYRKQLILGGVPFLALVLMLLLFQEQINSLFESSAPVNSTGPVLSSRVEPKYNEIVLRPPANEGQALGESEVAQPALPNLELDDQTTVVSVTSLPVPVEQLEPTAIPATSTKTAEMSGSLPVDDVLQLETASTPGVEMPLSPAVDELKGVGAKQVEEGATQEVEVVAEQPPHTASPGLNEPRAAKIAQHKLPAESAGVVETPDVVGVTETVSGKTITPSDQPQEAGGTKRKDPYVEAVDWVLSQPSQHYTLQLIAVENVQSLERFIRINNLSKHTFTLKTQRSGAPWYSLLWGAFADKEQALQAKKELPLAVQKGGVWPRTFGSLQ